MPLHSGRIPGYGWVKSLDETTRPSSSALGNTVTLTSTTTEGTYGSYAVAFAGANVTYDVQAIEIWATNCNTSGAARRNMIDIGTDPAGGTAYASRWSNILVPSATQLSAATHGVGHRFHLPLFIPAGHSIALKMATSGTTARNGTFHMVLYGNPYSPELMPTGQKLIPYGVTAGTVSGTALTVGCTDSADTNGAWTEIGTVAAGEEPWYLMPVLGYSGTAGFGTGHVGHLDMAIGDATNKVVVAQTIPWTQNASEATQMVVPPIYCHPAVGDKIYLRAHVGVALASYDEANFYAAVYGVA